MAMAFVAIVITTLLPLAILGLLPRNGPPGARTPPSGKASQTSH
jgi:hypothetical protein